MKKDGQKRVRHGVYITDAQINLLQTWVRFVDRKGYQPTQVELAHLSGAAESQISTWMEMWEAQGLITRAQGIRSRWMTDRCMLMLEQIEELDKKWSDYYAQQQQFARRFGTTHSWKPTDIGVQRQNSRYEE